jgi:hypothetical protein
MRLIFKLLFVLILLAGDLSTPAATQPAGALKAGQSDECAVRLKLLYAGLKQFALENQGFLPSELGKLYEQSFVDRLSTFVCPDSGHQLVTAEAVNFDGDFVLLARQLTATGERTPLAQETDKRHCGGNHVLYSDGTVSLEGADAGCVAQSKMAPAITTPTVTTPGTLIPPTTTTTPIGTTPPTNRAIFTGVWTTDFGEMRLAQEGNLVKGSYPLQDGAIEGLALGNVLRFTWNQRGNNKSGTGRFTLAADGNAFVGQWNYGTDPDAPAEGNWNGARAAGSGTSTPPAVAPPVITPPTMAAPGWLGLITQTFVEKNHQQVRIYWMEASSPALNRLNVGDVLLSVDQVPLTHGQQIATLLAGKREGETLTFMVQREKQKQSVAVPLGRAIPANQRTTLALGEFRGQSFSGRFIACLDPNRRAASGVMSGAGMGSLEGTFEGTWDPDTGATQLPFKAKVKVVLVKVGIKGSISGMVDRTGRGSGAFTGTGPLGAENGAWQCASYAGAEMTVL